VKGVVLSSCLESHSVLAETEEVRGLFTALEEGGIHPLLERSSITRALYSRRKSQLRPAQYPGKSSAKELNGVDRLQAGGAGRGRWASGRQGLGEKGGITRWRGVPVER